MDLDALGCRYEDEHPGVFIGSDYVCHSPRAAGSYHGNTLPPDLNHAASADKKYDKGPSRREKATLFFLRSFDLLLRDNGPGKEEPGDQRSPCRIPCAATTPGEANAVTSRGIGTRLPAARLRAAPEINALRGDGSPHLQL